MATLFQIHANLNQLKSVTKEMATLWQPNDSILLLGATCSYVDWLTTYISDINASDESEKKIDNIASIYLLKEDIDALNDSAKLHLNIETPAFSIPLKVLNDTNWVALTQQMDKVITLTADS